MSVLHTLTKDNFENTLEKNSFVIMDFWAEWCAPCKAFMPTYEQVATENTDALFCKINVDDEPELAQAFSIRSIPTLIIMRDNVVIFSEAGSLPKSALHDLIQQARQLDMEKVRKEIEQAQSTEQ